MVIKFEMGWQLEGLSGSSDGFLSSGVIAENLNLDGKTPSENKLTILGMISAKTEGWFW